MNTTYSKTRIMVECALMIALSTVLSMIKIIQMPYGGGVTPLAMLPIILVSFRHGTRWGLLTAFVDSVLQLVLGLNNLSYCATFLSQVGCVLLDYILAYSVLGFAFAISKPFKNRIVGICLGVGAVCLLRLVCAWLSGMVIWGSYQAYYEWAANLPIWLYSLIYNGNYLLPETVLTIIGAVLLVKGAPKLFDRQAA